MTRSKSRSKSKNWVNKKTDKNAVKIEKNIFKSKDPKKIAKSLMNSAKHNKKRVTSSKQSASSMLNFYINRAGKKLPRKSKSVLSKTKKVLKKL